MINLHEIADILEDARSAQIGDREEIGSGSVNGVEEKEDTGGKDSQRTVNEQSAQVVAALNQLSGR